MKQKTDALTFSALSICLFEYLSNWFVRPSKQSYVPSVRRSVGPSVHSFVHSFVHFFVSFLNIPVAFFSCLVGWSVCSFILLFVSFSVDGSRTRVLFTLSIESSVANE